MAGHLTPPERIIRAWIIRLLRWRYRQRAAQISLIFFIILGGFLLQISALGQMLLIIYGLIALLFGIRSSDTFKMAVIALVFVPILFLTNNGQMAKSFSTYAFLLLGIGIVCSIAEQWRMVKKSKKALEISQKQIKGV